MPEDRRGKNNKGRVTMKIRLIVIVAALGACALFAAASAAAAATTAAADNDIKSTTTSASDEKKPKLPPGTLTPEQGGYRYVKYGKVKVPYWKGYYYINRVWVWRGLGRPAYAPPRFRPVLPEDAAVDSTDEEYTYVEYEGDTVAYYKGYYYIDGAWVWRGPGRPPFPPPKFRPEPPVKPAVGSVPAKAAPAKTKTKPAKASRVKSAPRRSAPAPKPPRR